MNQVVVTFPLIFFVQILIRISSSSLTSSMSEKKNNRRYNPDTLKLAVESIANGMPVKSASKTYSIPKTTLHYKTTGKYPIECSPGAPTVLTSEEESTLVKWIIHVAKMGFPVSKDHLLDSVAMLLKKKNRPNPFRENRPGRHWYESFLHRNAEISTRMCQNLINSRASVTEAAIRNWFLEIESYLKQNNLQEVASDPRRVFNADESAFFLCPKGKKVRTLKGSKTVYSHTSNDEKECITVLLTANAAGDVATPMVMHAYERIPQSIVTLMPNGWGLGKSESGWMTGESFFEYMCNVFFPWILKKGIPLPIIFYVDDHKSHLTLPLSEFCSQKQIVLISLLPNSTHMLQPMDVGVFRPLKNGWKKATDQFKIDNNREKLRKEHFAPLLDKVIKETLNEKMLKNAFKTCGLCPFNPNAISFDKLVTIPLAQREDNLIVNRVEKRCDFNNEQIDFIEELIGKEKIVKFRNCQGSNNWNGATEDTSLFQFWCNWSKSLNHRDNENHVDIIVEVQEGEDYSYLDDDNLLVDAKRIEEVLNKEKPCEKVDGDSLKDTFMENVFRNDIENLVETVTIENLEIEILDQDNLLFSNNETNVLEGRNKEFPTKTANISNPKINIISNIVLETNESEGNNRQIHQIEGNKNEEREANEQTGLNDNIEIDQTVRACTPKSPETTFAPISASIREEKLEQKLKKPKVTKPKIVKEKVKRRVLESDSDASRQSFEASAPNCEQHLNVDDYVVVKYDGIKYPGIIKDLRENEAFVSVMAPSGCNWKWPNKEDCIWYQLSEITEKIFPPTLNGNRGTYSVPELKKYLSFTV